MSKTEVKPSENGIKTGDLYYISWGYDQTNIDFFQVLSATKSSVRVRQVSPAHVRETADGPMCRTFRCAVPDEILPPVQSIFIKDNVRGDVKRVMMNPYCHEPTFKIDGRYTAHRYTGQELYESWYA